MIILETETTTIKTDHEPIFDNHIKILANFYPHKTIEAVRQNIKDKSIKYNLQMKQINNSRYRKYRNCRITVKSNTQTHFFYMLKVENDYETATESNHYQNEIISSQPQEPISNEDTKNYVQYKTEAISIMNNMYQKTTTKTSQQKEKNWTIPLLLESPKSEIFQSTELEIDFSIDTGAESNISMIPTWKEI